MSDTTTTKTNVNASTTEVGNLSLLAGLILLLCPHWFAGQTEAGWICVAYFFAGFVIVVVALLIWGVAKLLLAMIRDSWDLFSPWSAKRKRRAANRYRH